MTQALLWSRPLAPLVAALAAGIAAPSLGLAFPPILTASLIAAGLLLSAVLCWRGLPLAWAVCLLFFCLGQGLYHTALQPDLPEHHVRFLPPNTPLTLMGVVQSRPLFSATDCRLELAASARLSGSGWQPACGTIWLSGLSESTKLQPGDQVAVRLVLWPVEDLKNPGSIGRKLALARRQIYTTGRLWQQSQPVQLATGSTLPWLAAWREQAQNYCRSLLAPQPQPARSLFLALLLGDQSEISQPLRQALNRTGATHVVSVSGMHLAIVAGFSFYLVFWLLRRSAWLLLRLNALKWAVFLATGPVVAYVWLAEGSPATQRSAIMILAYMVLVLLDRHRDIYSALILAAFVILVVSPLQLYAISFQLSFLAVWGLAYLSPVLLRPWQNWLAERENLAAWIKKSVLWVGEAWSVSLAATLATLPVIVASFHQAPTYGLLVNILVTPLIGGVALILGFSGLLLSFLPLPLTSGLLFLGRLVLDVSVYLIEKAASLPGVVVRLPAPTAWQTAAYFLLLISLLRARRPLWRWTGVSVGLLLTAGSLAWSGLHSLTGSQLVLTALDTPREMALMATFPGGVSMVINAGAPSYFDSSSKANFALISYVHAQRLRRLDYLAALTVTKENAGTLLALAQDFEVGQFWYSGDRPDIPGFWELRNILGDSRKEVKNLSLKPLTQEIGGAVVRTMQLAQGDAGRSTGPVMLQFDYLGKRLLLVPPAPAAWRQKCLAAGLSPNDVLILPAANLRGDFSKTCISQVKPQIVVVTGAIPDALSSELSQQRDIAWRFTRQGAVTLTISSRGVEVNQWRP